MKFALLSFALILTPLVLAAQTNSYGVARMENLYPSQSSAPDTLSGPSVRAMPNFCPVSLRAQHGASGAMVQADKSLPKGPAQLLHLTLINPDSRRIVSAKFTVRGASGKARVTQALSSSDSGQADAIRSLEVKFSSAPGNTATGDLWVPGMTAVLTIDLTSVTFADGSTRNFAPQDACRVAPELKMLVASH
jgi:hypothetical protein